LVDIHAQQPSRPAFVIQPVHGVSSYGMGAPQYMHGSHQQGPDPYLASYAGQPSGPQHFQPQQHYLQQPMQQYAPSSQYMQPSPNTFFNPQPQAPHYVSAQPFVPSFYPSFVHFLIYF
jgi:hypothetical protein